jgi:hypothetical protein
MTTLKNIAILQDKIYSSNFDISKVLPNEEVINKITISTV